MTSSNPVNAPQHGGAAQFVAPFSITDGPVQQFLGQHLMQVPEIQRPYAWKLENAEELVRDLNKMEAARLQGAAQPQHYLGSLVVVTHAGQRDEIVDGQQRLTTISVLVGQLVRAFNELATRSAGQAATNKNPAYKQAFLNIEQNARNRVTILTNLLQVQKGIDPNTQLPLYEPRLVVSPEITETYSDLISGGDGTIASARETKQPAKDLGKIAQFMYREFVTGDEFKKLQEAAQLQHLDVRANQVTLGLIWVRLATPFANAAAELFESLNARGRPLNVLGLVKVWLLGTLKQANASPAVVSQVASDFRSLSDDDDEIAVDYFTDFYRVRSLDEKLPKSVTPKTMSLLAREKMFRDPALNSAAKAVPLSQIAQLISSEIALMKQLWPTWNVLTHGSPQAAPKLRSLHRLPDVCAAANHPNFANSRLHLLLDKRGLSHQIVYPFLTAAADHLGSVGQPDQFVDLVHDLEKFFFRAKSICNIDPKEIHKLYFQQLEQLKLHGSLNIQLLKTNMRSLITTYASDKKFGTELLNVCLYKDNNPILPKYLLSMIHLYSSALPVAANTPMKPILLGGELLNLGEWQVEHIVPQRPRPGQHQLLPDQVDRLGNICLLPPPWNGFLTNHDFQTKRQMVTQRLLQQGLSVDDTKNIFTDPLFATTQWTSKDVATREARLVARALEIFII